MMLPLHHLQELNRVQPNQTNLIKSPNASTLLNHIPNNRIVPVALENETLSKTSDANTIIANVTNHTAKTVVTSPELEPLNQDYGPICTENGTPRVHTLTNGFCDNSENIYGNIVGSPLGNESKTGVETVSITNEIKLPNDENESNGDDNDMIIPIVSSKGINDISSALQHTKNQLVMKHHRAIHEPEGSRGFAGDLATQLGILVLREKQKQCEDQDEEMQHLYEPQQRNHIHHTNNVVSNVISSSHTSPKKNIKHNNHCAQHDKPRLRKKSNPNCSRNGNEGASAMVSLSKAASMSELDGPDTENIALINNITSCSGAKIISNGHIEALAASHAESMVCYKNGRRRKHKKKGSNYPQDAISPTKNLVPDDDSNLATTIIAPFCGNCAISTLSRVNPCHCEHDKTNEAENATFNRMPRQTKKHEETHNLSSRSCNRIAPSMSPPYDIAEPPSCREIRKNKRPSVPFRHQDQYTENPHEQQFHYLNSQDHHHHHVRDNTTVIATPIPNTHDSYHRQPLIHHHHRSQGQLLIDDADILHQCLVSLAGERNVAMLLKRFQQRAQNNALSNDGDGSPC